MNIITQLVINSSTVCASIGRWPIKLVILPSRCGTSSHIDTSNTYIYIHTYLVSLFLALLDTPGMYTYLTWDIAHGPGAVYVSNPRGDSATISHRSYIPSVDRRSDRGLIKIHQQHPIYTCIYNSKPLSIRCRIAFSFVRSFVVVSSPYYGQRDMYSFNKTCAFKPVYMYTIRHDTFRTMCVQWVQL